MSESGSSVAGEIVWFNSHLVKLGGTIPTSDFTIYVQNGKITFGPSTLTVPNTIIRFTASVTCASTTFDTVSNQWVTTLPLSSASQADEIFAAGLAYLLPANFAQNVSNVTWSATVYSTAPALQVSWQYGVSNWLTQKNGTSFPVLMDGTPDYNGMMINPAHNAPLCNASYNSGDHAGAPEFTGRQNVLNGGGSGGGGSNWTGSFSSTPPMVAFVCSSGALGKGDTATIGFWHNKNGQALIDSLNGGPTATNLANWLASQFPYLYGASSANNMTGKTNADVAAPLHDVLQRDGPEDQCSDSGKRTCFLRHEHNPEHCCGAVRLQYLNWWNRDQDLQRRQQWNRDRVVEQRELHGNAAPASSQPGHEERHIQRECLQQHI